MSQLAREIFKLGGLLLEEGARTTENTGLTPHRLRVLGVLTRAASPLTVPHVAREMGLARQSVQRLVDLMVDDGFLHYQENPVHVRSRLLTLTKKGEVTYSALAERMRISNASMARGLSVGALSQALDVLATLSATLQANAADE